LRGRKKLPASPELRDSATNTKDIGVGKEKK